MGRVRPSRMGAVSARQDQPELLHERAQLVDRTDLRVDRQDPWPHARRPRDSKVETYARTVESAVVHYGGTTLAFLNNWYRADQRNTALTYVSAVAIEEKSVIDYNSGNPDGVLDPGRKTARNPRAVGRGVSEGRNALFGQPLLRARRVVGRRRREGSRCEVRGVRATNRTTRRGCSSSASGRATPTWPSARRSPRPTASTQRNRRRCSKYRQPHVMTGLLDRWAQQRKGARILFLLDVSGSMGDAGDVVGRHQTRPRAASRGQLAARKSKATTHWGSGSSARPRAEAERRHLEIVPVGPVDKQRDALVSGIQNQRPRRNAALQRHRRRLRAMLATYDPTRINAVVVLTDGINDDGTPSDDDRATDDIGARPAGEQRRAAIRSRCGSSRSPTAKMPTRPRSNALPRPASAATYDASDPRSIDRVFHQRDLELLTDESVSLKDPHLHDTHGARP